MKSMIDEYLALIIIGVVLIILAVKNPFTTLVADIIKFSLGALCGYLGRGTVTTKESGPKPPVSGGS